MCKIVFLGNNMVNADELLAGIQPQLDAFLRPDEARRAADVLKAALKEFATDAFTNLQLVRERAGEEEVRGGRATRVGRCSSA